MQRRVHNAQTSATARGATAELDDFKKKTEESKAVISRSLPDILTLQKGDEFSYASFARQVRAGTRDATDNEFDKTRLQFENALFPNYSEHILFGSLSLNERGMSGYDIILKEKMIANRATVFEENPHIFSVRHRLGLTDVIPAGYRAVWDNRSSLCIAKLHGSVQKGMTSTDFVGIFQTDQGGTGDSDFVEVHIYGTLNRKTIEKVVGSQPSNREDKLLWRLVCRDLNEAGVETETR